MINKTDRYRLALYTNFAYKAKSIGLRWCVAHGSEGYPDSIGRDLDILCYDAAQVKEAVRMFVETAMSDYRTKWLIEPNPIWGKRVLAVSDKYEVAELHILYKINSGLIDCPVDWNKVSDNLFPQNYEVTYFKSVLMPFLGGSAKVERYTEEQINKLPWYLKRLLRKNLKKKRITIFDKLLVYINMFRRGVISNYIFSRSIKRLIPEAATTPIVLLKNDSLIIEKIKLNLSEVFGDFICGDNLNLEKINYHRSRQRLIYITNPRTDIAYDISIKDDSKETLDSLVHEFFNFNQCKKEIYIKQYRNIYLSINR